MIVGYSAVTTPHGRLVRPWRYADGALEELPLWDPTRTAWATAVNGDGDLAGSARIPATGQRYGLLWPADRPGVVERFDVPGVLNTVVAISDDGIVSGTLGSTNTPTAWLRRPSGDVVLVDVPGSSGVSLRAGRGRWAAGAVYRPGQPHAAVLVDVETATPTVLSTGGYPVGVSAYGAVLFADRVERAGSVTVLGSPGGSAAGAAIADDGTVTGWHNPNEPSGAVYAVRWLPSA